MCVLDWWRAAWSDGVLGSESPAHDDARALVMGILIGSLNAI